MNVRVSIKTLSFLCQSVSCRTVTVASIPLKLLGNGYWGVCPPYPLQALLLQAATPVKLERVLL
jgi:hypothetical protein